eukprot:scaffold12319_cov112-Isochrysis_galbana.AAC.5
MERGCGSGISIRLGPSASDFLLLFFGAHRPASHPAPLTRWAAGSPYTSPRPIRAPLPHPGRGTDRHDGRHHAV